MLPKESCSRLRIFPEERFVPELVAVILLKRTLSVLLRLRLYKSSMLIPPYITGNPDSGIIHLLDIIDMVGND